MTFKKLARISFICLFGIVMLPRPILANEIRWNVDGNGEWLDPSNWTPEGIPAPLDTAIIENPSTSQPVTVTLASPAPIVVDRLIIAANPNRHRLVIDGTFHPNEIVNNGDIELNGRISLLGAGTIAGAGSIRMLDDESVLTGAFALDIGSSQAIKGIGRIDGSFDFTNSGTVDADVPGGVLQIQSSTSNLPQNSFGVIQMGTLRASNGGILDLGLNDNGLQGYTGFGVYQALDHSEIRAQFTAIAGGILDTQGSGQITLGGSYLSAVANYGKLRIEQPTFQPTIVDDGLFNAGTIAVLGQVTSQSWSDLTGLGQVHLAGGFVERMTNVDNTISGYGGISGITNHGSVHADESGMTLSTRGLANSGAVVARNGGILRLESPSSLADPELQDFPTGGGIFTAEAGSTIEILTLVEDTQFVTVGNGNLLVPTNEQGHLSNTTLSGDLNIDGTLRLSNNITNEGLLSWLAADSVKLTIEADTTLDGGGTIRIRGGLINSDGNYTLSNVDNTIAGYGSVYTAMVNHGTVRADDGQTLTFTSLVTNNGVVESANGGNLHMLQGVDGTGMIHADDGTAIRLGVVNGQTLRTTGNGVIYAETLGDVVNLGTLDSMSNLTISGSFVNEGQVVALGAVQLFNATLQGSGTIPENAQIDAIGAVNVNVDHRLQNVTINSFGLFENRGVIEAVGGGTLRLNGGGPMPFTGSGGYVAREASILDFEADFADTTLRSIGTGVVRGTGTLRNVVLEGVIELDDAVLEETITNHGQVSILSSTLVRADHLSGAGTYSLSDSLQFANPDMTTIDATIEGFGWLVSANRTKFSVQGLIHANVTGLALAVNPRGASLEHSGEFRASNGGRLIMQGTHEGGHYHAMDGSAVDIVGRLSSATLQTTGTGAISANSSAIVDVMNLGNLVFIGDNALGGTFGNTGNVAWSGIIRLEDDVVIDHSGSITLMNSLVNSPTTPFTLTNRANGISGEGFFQNTRFVNKGTLAVNSQMIFESPATVGLVPSVINEGTIDVPMNSQLVVTNFDAVMENRAGGRIALDGELVIDRMLRNAPGGRIEGNGYVQGSSQDSQLWNDGIVAPGGSGIVGVLIAEIGFYQTRFGSLEIDLSDGGNDQLSVTGLVDLAGSLEVHLTEPAVNILERGTIESYVIVSSMQVGIDGEFDTLVYDSYPLDLSAPQDIGTYRILDGAADELGTFRILQYTNTEVVFSNYLAIPGDANGDGGVDLDDLHIWLSFNGTAGTDWTMGDFDGNGVTNQLDFDIWLANRFTTASQVFANVPEPFLNPLFALVLLNCCMLSRNRTT